MGSSETNDDMLSWKALSSTQQGGDKQEGPMQGTSKDLSKMMSLSSISSCTSWSSSESPEQSPPPSTSPQATTPFNDTQLTMRLNWSLARHMNSLAGEWKRSFGGSKKNLLQAIHQIPIWQDILAFYLLYLPALYLANFRAFHLSLSGVYPGKDSEETWDPHLAESRSTLRQSGLRSWRWTRASRTQEVRYTSRKPTTNS